MMLTILPKFTIKINMNAPTNIAKKVQIWQKKKLDGRKNSKESTKQQPGKCTGSLSCDGRLICIIHSIVLLENSWSHSKNGLYL